jgi:hypothetical protein
MAGQGTDPMSVWLQSPKLQFPAMFYVKYNVTFTKIITKTFRKQNFYTEVKYHSDKSDSWWGQE